MGVPYEDFWPRRLPFHLQYPEVPLFRAIEVTAEFYPEKTAINYYGKEISYSRLDREIKAVAGALSNRGVKKGDRVAIYLQNTPHYVAAFLGIMRANAVVVPANPMLSEKELSFILRDTGATAVITTADLLSRGEKAVQENEIDLVIAGKYSDYLPEQPSLPVPDFMNDGNKSVNCTEWNTILKEDNPPPEIEVVPDDLCLLPYTSGSTGVPKGCKHTHKTVISNVVSAYYWLTNTVSAVHLSTLPFFHVTGLIHSLLAPLYAGAEMVLLTRWDRKAALDAIEKYRCTHWINITTMVIDLLNDDEIEKRDLSSLMIVGGGGAPLPVAVGHKLKETLGLDYIEGYGLTETISQTHFNPPDRPKMQCIGIPDFGVDARIVNIEDLKELPPNSNGELVINGPEVFQGYWQRPEDTKNAFIELNGKQYFCTGDVCYMDEEGYFFIVDRTKRMINAAGYKVWPAEVENYLYRHPAIKEACVVGVADPVRVENVRAYVVLNEEYKNETTAEELISWSKEQMAAYKYPREVVFVDDLPKSGTGKVLWRQLQEKAKEETIESNGR